MSETTAPRYFTLAEVMDTIDGSRYTGAWCVVRDIWIHVPHGASEDDLRAAMNELQRRADKKEAHAPR